MTAPKERPIIFSGESVRAILSGAKGQTRRVMKPQPSEGWEPRSYGDVHKMLDGEFVWCNEEPVLGGWGPSSEDGMEAHPCPFGQPGERLWVREGFSGDWTLHQLPPREWPDCAPVHYWADGNPEHGDWTPPKPSIFMPRWASRLTLAVVSVRVERLQGISEGDAIAEGWEGGAAGNPGNGGPFDWFRGTWDSINGKKPGHAWADNPWVWVIEFRPTERTAA